MFVPHYIRQSILYIKKKKVEASVIKCGGFQAQTFARRIIFNNQSYLEFDDKVSSIVKEKTRSGRMFYRDKCV